MTQKLEQLLKVQNQLIYKVIDPSIKVQCVTRVGVPHPLQTTIGTWIHVTIIQNNQMFDPNNCLVDKINLPKEHSIYIYNPFLDLKSGLDNIPLKQLLKCPENVPTKIPLARIHSSCRYGDTFGSLRCDCGPQLFAAKKAIVQNGLGFILYLDQEGRNIGLLLKAASYRLMQQFGVATDQSLIPLKINDADLRSYQVAVDSFKIFGVTKVQLLTNNPKKFELLLENGIQIVQRQLSIMATQHNKKYLLTKKQNMGHDLLDPQHDVSQGHSPTKIAQVVNRIHQQINSQNVGKFQHILWLDSASTNNSQQEHGYAAFFSQKKHPKYFFLSNFYDQLPVKTLEDGWFRCSEGLYQYQKFKHLNDLQLKDQMQKFNGQKSFKISRQLNHKVVKDWESKKLDAMKYVLKFKFSDQNLKQKLLQTGQRYIVQNCHKNFDAFWADNGDGTGKNMMGLLLMQLRQQFGGKGVVKISKSLQRFYQLSCSKCQDPCVFDNDGQVHQKCVYHSGLLQN